jgi:hypothetical protein
LNGRGNCDSLQVRFSLKRYGVSPLAVGFLKADDLEGDFSKRQKLFMAP